MDEIKTIVDDDSAIEYNKLMLPLYTDTEISEEIRRYSNEVGNEELKRQFGIVGSYGELLRRLSETNTQQSLFIKETIGKLTDTSMLGEAYEHKGDESNPGYVLKNSNININRQFNGGEVSSKEAKMYVLGRNSNIKRIILYNSGFYIVIRSPKLVELNLLYNNIGTSFEEYGRLMGALFYMYSDMKIKNHIFEFIENLIIGSNLERWDKHNRLMDNISIHDYQLILLHIASLMYKSGYTFKTVCFHCKSVSETIIDLNLLQLTDFSRIPETHRMLLSTNDVVNKDRINSYKADLNLIEDIVVGDYRLTLKVPSIGGFTKYGNTFNDNMANAIHDMTDADVIQQYLRYSYCTLYEPWIDSISVIDYENPSKTLFVVKERDGIMTILDEIQSIGLSDDFAVKITDFIHKSSITNIGYIAVPCDKCTELPTNVVNGIIPIDIQNSFFSVLVMRLIQD